MNKRWRREEYLVRAVWPSTGWWYEFSVVYEGFRPIHGGRAWNSARRMAREWIANNREAQQAAKDHGGMQIEKFQLLSSTDTAER
jgi:hypothetical protein